MCKIILVFQFLFWDRLGKLFTLGAPNISFTISCLKHILSPTKMKPYLDDNRKSDCFILQNITEIYCYYLEADISVHAICCIAKL